MMETMAGAHHTGRFSGVKLETIASRPVMKDCQAGVVHKQKTVRPRPPELEDNRPHTETTNQTVANTASKDRFMRPTHVPQHHHNLLALDSTVDNPG